MITATDIRSAIIGGQFSNDELVSIQQALTFANAQLARQKIRAFTTGSVVKFTSNRNGQRYNGVVEKVGKKNIVVRTPVGLYRVPANMLEVA
jgi:uncharacterized SAM-binding protein YcdF (DUF218 family)